MEKLRALFADAQSWFSRLTQRERRLVAFTGVAASCFLIFMVVWSFNSSAADYRRRTADKISQLGDVQTLAASYRDAEQVRQGVERQLTASNIKLIGFLEEKGTAAGLDIPTMNPKSDLPLGDGKIIESAVELTLNDVTLAKLVDFLANVETGPGVVKVKYLRVEPRVASATLTAWVTIATYHMKP